MKKEADSTSILSPVCIFFFLLSAGYTMAVPANWPTWRGPDIMGISPDGTPPLTWSETENIKWKVALEGDGSNSSPVIWGDKLFFQTAVWIEKQPAALVPSQPRQEEGSQQRSSGRGPSDLYRFNVVCLDRHTGKTLWQTQVCQVVPHEGHHGDHGFVSFSPVTDGALLWADFGSRGIYCLTPDGRIKWQKDLGKMRIYNGFGEGNSPLLVDDKLVVLRDHEDQSFIVALNKDSGDICWRKDRDEITSWTTPIAVQVDGKMQVVVNGRNRIRSYDAASGEILWECGGQTDCIVPTPVLGFGMVFCTSGFRGAKLSAIRLGHSGDLTGTDAVAWEINEATPYVPSPLLYGEKVYVLSGNNATVYCYNAKTGAPYYTKQNLNGIRGIYASPVGAAGRVYFAGRNGVTCVLDNTGDELKMLAVNTLDDGFECSPAVVGDNLYLKGKKSLYCITQTKVQ